MCSEEYTTFVFLDIFLPAVSLFLIFFGTNEKSANVNKSKTKWSP
jgi:low temperature requirement protein LtrA